MADNIIEFDKDAEHLSPNQVTKDILYKLIGSPVLQSPQVKKELEVKIEKEVSDINSDPSKEAEFLQAVEDIGELGDKEAKKLKGLELTYNEAPEAWSFVYGGLTPDEVMKKERAIPQKPPKGGSQM